MLKSNLYQFKDVLTRYRLSNPAFHGRVNMFSIGKYMYIQEEITNKLIQINNLVSEYSNDSKYSKRCFCNQIESFLIEMNEKVAALNELLEVEVRPPWAQDGAGKLHR